MLSIRQMEADALRSHMDAHQIDGHHDRFGENSKQVATGS